MFVTRLHSQTLAGDTDALVYDETGLRIKCEKLITKYDTYSSFCIRCADTIAEKFLNPNIWPKGVMVKKYLE